MKARESKMSKLKLYKELMLLCKTLQIINKIDMEIETTYENEKANENKVKVLTLFR